MHWRWELTLAACIAVSLGILTMSETGHRRLTEGFDLGLRSMWAKARLGELLSVVLEAETAQRGYLYTKRELYLEPFAASRKRSVILQDEIRDYYMRINDPVTLRRFGQLIEGIGAKYNELDVSIKLVREGNAASASALVNTDVGQYRMRQIHDSVNALQVVERERAAALVDNWRQSLTLARFGITTITVLNIVLLAYVVRKFKLEWLQSQEREVDLNNQVKLRTEQLASLSSHLQEVSETEKTRLGRELHDELGAILTATRMDLLWVRGRIPPDQSPLLEKIRRAIGNLDQGIAVKRRIIEDLRPSILSSFGLVTAARETAEQAAERAGWRLTLDLPDDDPDLDEEVEIAMFRILQEALTNAAKYAKATELRVKLRVDLREGGSCELEVKDNGVGFRQRDVRPTAHGLAGMRQRLEPRGGALVVDSAPRRGTIVRARLPVRPHTAPTDPPALAAG